MASNDPTDNGGLFIGRRPGTAPIRFRVRERRPGEVRGQVDSGLAWLLLAVELALCLSLMGPQPLGWMWVGSQVEYQTGAVTAGITTIMLGTLASLMLTMVLAKRVDYWWKLTRRAGGHHQERGALERIFVLACGIAIVGFAFWFFLIEGPGPSLAPTN
jgi:hypothetical protein